MLVEKRRTKDETGVCNYMGGGIDTRYKKLLIAVIAVLLVAVIALGSVLLYIYTARPKLSTLSGPILRIFLWFNGYSAPEGCTDTQLKKDIALIEENPGYGCGINHPGIAEGWRELAAVVNKYYGIE